MIDPDSALPAYEQLAVILGDEIAQGMLSGKVPSIHEISEHHGVSHRTAARALSVLEGQGKIGVELTVEGSKMGKIVSVPGQGHYVRADRPR